ncbi:hypothetical protein [Actinomadura sp. 9N215]|uniref:hypothetical protein n=1 Tax=Actinomadura sp. 9N215 TaxID=3375150 RepID=UPI003790335D
MERGADPGTGGRARVRPDDPPLIQRVRGEAFEHIGRGMYDPWSFDVDALPPYLVELRAEREREILRLQHDLAEAPRASRTRVETSDAQAGNAATTVRHLERRLAETSRQEGVVRARLDHLAAAEARRRPLPPDPGAPDDKAPPPDRPDEADVPGADAREHCDHDPHPHECWEGLHTEPPLRGRWKMGILLGLIGVEVPIQREIFRYFHGDSIAQQIETWIFTLPVAAIMILLPHLSGHLYRGRHVTGSERVLGWLPLALLVPWFYLAYVLGGLRAKVLLVPPRGPDGELIEGMSPVDQLDLTPSTISVMYVALLLITGGIAFLMGLAREHPLQVAYRGAYRDRREAEAGLVAAEPGARDSESELAQARADLEEQTRFGDVRLEEGTERIHALYDQAELAYLEALGEAVGAPAFTEAISRASQALHQGPRRPRAQARSAGP